MALSSAYKNNNIQSYTEIFINNEFCPDNNIKSNEIIRVVDYTRNTDFDKYGPGEFYIDAFICVIQNNNFNQYYCIYHYWGEFNWIHDKKMTFVFCKLDKFPFTDFGKKQIDLYFSKIESQYGNNEYYY